MKKIFNNKFLSWFIVGFLILLSPLVLESIFKDEINNYHENKKTYDSLLVEVQNFKNIYYAGRIPKEDYLDLTKEFKNSFNVESLKITSAIIEKSIFKVIVELAPSPLSCLVRNEISISTNLVKSLSPLADCKSEISLYQFSAI